MTLRCDSLYSVKVDIRGMTFYSTGFAEKEAAESVKKTAEQIPAIDAEVVPGGTVE